MRSLPLVLGALLIAGCSQTNATDDMPRTDTPVGSSAGRSDSAMAAAPSAGGVNAVMSPEQFVNAVAASDAYEIASSELALDRIPSGELRAFAQRMIPDHRRSSADLKSAAGSIQPSAGMTPAQQQMIQALRNAQGAQFASLYRDQQLQVHRQTLETLRTFASSGEHAALRQFAARTAPVVQAHLEMLQGMSG